MLTSNIDILRISDELVLFKFDFAGWLPFLHIPSNYNIMDIHKYKYIAETYHLLVDSRDEIMCWDDLRNLTQHLSYFFHV
jgi:hypothetical protein